MAAVQTAAIASATAASSGRLPPGRRPLRMRPPGLPFMGTCDVVISQVSGVGALHRPYLVIGLEGQEFRAEEVAGKGNPGTRNGLRYQFSMGSLQSNLQVYIYQDVQGPHCVVGRILVPLTDVIWPLGQVPGRAKLQAGFKKQEEPYRRDYALQFLPPSVGGDGFGDAAFLDCYSPATVNGASGLSFGTVSLDIEVALRPELGPLLGFYASAVIQGAQRVNMLGDQGGPFLYKGRPGLGRPVSMFDDTSREANTADALIHGSDFRSILRSLERLRHRAATPSLGLMPWLRRNPTNAIVSAVAWFIFCILGFFPCSLFMVPIYAWLLLAANGLAAATQRNQEWAARTPKGDQKVEDAEQQQQQAEPLFWDDTATAEAIATNAGGDSYVAQCRKILSDAEPIILTEVAAWERLRNALSFADGIASTAVLAGLGLVAVLVCFSLLTLKEMDPSLCFFCGTYGAMGIFGLSRAGPVQKTIPMWLPWAFNEALACVPDDAQVAHRFVATKVQSVEVSPPV